MRDTEEDKGSQVFTKEQTRKIGKTMREMERRRNHRIPHFADVTEHGNPVAEKGGKGR